MTTTEANVAAVVIVSVHDATFTDVLVVDVLKRVARASSLIVTDRAEVEGGAVNELRSRVDVEAVSSSEMTTTDKEAEVSFVLLVLEVVCEAHIESEATEADKGKTHCANRSRIAGGSNISAAASLLNLE